MSARRLLWALLLLAAHARVHAADCPAVLTPEQQAEYDTLTKKGVVEFELQHWDEAKVHFTRAHALLANARTLRALGLIAFEQRSYVAARELLTQALDSRCRALTQTMRDDAGKLLADARSFVSDLKLLGLPPGAAVRIDDTLVQVPPSAVVQLDPGTHEIRVQSPGQAPQTRSVRASSGEPVTLELEPAHAVEQPPPPPARALPAVVRAPEASTRVGTQRWVAIGVGAGGVVALGVGIVSSVLAVSTKHKSDSECIADACRPRGAELRETATTQADVATVSFIAAGALLGGALATYLLAPGSERAPTAGLRITPLGVAARF